MLKNTLLARDRDVPRAGTAACPTPRVCYNRGMRALETLRLGETPDPVQVATREEAAAVALTLARQARRTLDLVSRHLDPWLYDREEFVEAVKHLALGSRRALIRVLVQDVDPVLRDGHRLVALAQRLPTFLQIRVPAPQFREFNQAFLVADGVGYLHRELADRFEGRASFHEPATARDLLRVFQPMWEAAQPDPNLRALRV